jgi:hypothetical protein
MEYIDEVSNHLTKMLKALPKEDAESEMSECEAIANNNGYLNSWPSHESPEKFVQQMFDDPGMRHLTRQDRYRLAMSAETPSELVMNMLPSDGHLD